MKRNWQRYALGLVVGLLGWPLLVAAQALPNQRAPARSAAVVPPPVLDATTQAARNIGIQACLPAIQRLSVMSINGSRGNDVVVDWDRKNPGSGPFFSLTGIEVSDGAFAVSINAVPTGNGACSFSAERISVAPIACRDIARSELVGYAETRLLPTFAVYTQKNDVGASVSLIDTPPGCLIIRRQVTFDWAPPVGAAK